MKVNRSLSKKIAATDRSQIDSLETQMCASFSTRNGDLLLSGKDEICEYRNNRF